MAGTPLAQTIDDSDDIAVGGDGGTIEGPAPERSSRAVGGISGGGGGSGKKPGRSSRRRRRKARAILEAAAAAATWDATAGATVTSSVVPSDRGYAPLGARERRREGCGGGGGDGRRRCSRDDRGEDDCIDGPYVDDDEEEENASLPLADARALRSQLGFVPGNAVRIAARLPGELSTALQANDAYTDDSQASHPTVVELYPLAVREAYRGGKSDGRAFKGRRRGASRLLQEEGGGDDSRGLDVSETGGTRIKTNAKAEMKKRERSWLVHPSIKLNQNLPDSYENDANNQQKGNHQDPRRIVEPFPTLYWLTSPLLRAQISKLEISKDHGVSWMEERLRASPYYLEQMARAHGSYGRRRWELLTDEDRTSVIERGWKGALDGTRGVAGIRLGKEGSRGGQVKCLHAHAAHYLAQVEEGEQEEDDLNLVGKWTMEAVLESIS